MKRTHIYSMGCIFGLLLPVAGFASASEALSQATEAARDRFLLAITKIESGDLSAAIEQFEAAYSLAPHPNVLFNLGRASYELGDEAKALSYFERYLDSGVLDRQEAEAMIALMNQSGPQNLGQKRQTNCLQTILDEDEELVLFGAARIAARLIVDGLEVTRVATARDIRIMGLASMPELFKSPDEEIQTTQ